eukprot:PhM_4_TR15963/c0_g4_i3/m.45801
MWPFGCRPRASPTARWFCCRRRHAERDLRWWCRNSPGRLLDCVGQNVLDSSRGRHPAAARTSGGAARGPERRGFARCGKWGYEKDKHPREDKEPSGVGDAQPKLQGHEVQDRWLLSTSTRALHDADSCCAGVALQPQHRCFRDGAPGTARQHVWVLPFACRSGQHLVQPRLHARETQGRRGAAPRHELVCGLRHLQPAIVPQPCQHRARATAPGGAVLAQGQRVPRAAPLVLAGQTWEEVRQHPRRRRAQSLAIFHSGGTALVHRPARRSRRRRCCWALAVVADGRAARIPCVGEEYDSHRL